MGRASGNSGSSSGGRSADCWGSGELCLMDSSSVILEGVPDGDSGDQMEKGEIISEAGWISGGLGDDMSSAEGMHAKALEFATSICQKLAGQMVGGSSAAPHSNGAASPCPHGEGMDVEVCMQDNCLDNSCSGECSRDSLNVVVNDVFMVQGKAHGSHALHGDQPAVVVNVVLHQSAHHQEEFPIPAFIPVIIVPFAMYFWRINGFLLDSCTGK